MNKLNLVFIILLLKNKVSYIFDFVNVHYIGEDFENEHSKDIAEKFFDTNAKLERILKRHDLF